MLMRVLIRKVNKYNLVHNKNAKVNMYVYNSDNRVSGCTDRGVFSGGDNYVRVLRT